MATSKADRRALQRAAAQEEQKPGFDITCVVGRVEYGGGENPYEVAFQIIARHGAPGQFSFPLPDGSGHECTVDVQFNDPNPPTRTEVY